MNIVARISKALLLTGLSLALAFGSALAASEKKPKNEYPNATRKEPSKVEINEKAAKKINAANEFTDKKEYDKAEAALNEVLALPKVTKAEQARAYLGLSAVAYEREQYDKAIEYNEKAIALDALENTNHFIAMYQIAQLQLQEERYDKALAAMDAWLQATGSQKPEALALKANALYRLERFDEAAATMKMAIEKSDKPNDSWNQILLASYAESGKTGDAAAAAEAALKKNPNDKRVVLQLASIYLDAKQDDKALATLEGAYKRGLLTEEKELKQLYQTYNYTGHPKEAAEVIQAGMSKGTLNANFDTYKALGDSYAIQAEEITKNKGDAGSAWDHAIEAYTKAGQLSKDGEADYLRGQLLIQERDKFEDGKQAITLALSKGTKHPGEAYVLLGNAEQQLGNDAAASAAYQKAATYPNTKKMAESWLHNMKIGAKPAGKKK
jgi:tetratricopeptide (TPR) repeat protein